MALPLITTPKGVTKGGNTIDMYLCKKRNATTSVISYLSVPEYGMPNASNLRDAFPLTVLPKGVKRGNKGDICFT